MNKSRIILANKQSISMDCKETKRNNNVLVVGASGSGKTRSIVTPNLLQDNGSKVILDPKGNLYNQYKAYLESKGYAVKTINFIHPEKSVPYNALSYIHNSNDIRKVAAMLTADNYTGSRNIDPYWDNMAELFVTAMISLLVSCDVPYEKNISGLLAMVKDLKPNNGCDIFQVPLDEMVNEIEMEHGDILPVKLYHQCRLAPLKTYLTILSTIISKLGAFQSENLNDMLAYDEVNIASLGLHKTVLFVIVSDTDRSMDKLANIFFTQAMNELCLFADEKCDNCCLPIPVQFILDDFATNCKIEEFPRMISSIRSRGISVMLMIQAESQLTAGYQSDDKTIISNCDTYIYLGGNDVETAESVAKRCQKPLSSVLYMPVNSCWIFRRGEKPIYTQTFDLASYELYQKAMEFEKN